MNDKAKKIEDALVEAISNQNMPRKKTMWQLVFYTFITTLALVAFVYSGFKLVSHQNPGEPSGKINKPTAGSFTDCEVCVAGRTKNIKAGQYVWLTVDKPEKGLTFPKLHVYEPNIGFQTTIQENGKEEPYNISLYILDQKYHDLWLAWQTNNEFGGLHMPPENKRLDTVRVILKG